MTKPYLILAAVAALLVPAEARAADAVVLSIKSRSALRGVTIQPVAPAASDRTAVRLPVKAMTAARGVGTVELGGALRFRAGRRSTTATALRLTTGTTSSALSGKLGRTRVTLFAASGRPVLD